MAFGVLELPPGQAQPPGTEILEILDNGNRNTNAVPIPQPSESPKDPLNLSRVRKELFFVSLIYGSSITGVVGPVLVPGFSIVAAAFNIGLTQVTLLNGSLVMALGLSSYLCAPLAQLYGRRVVYLVTTLVMTFGCVWSGYAETYNSLLGSRILQGLGMGSFFSLGGTASINDVYFVHERGRRVGVWNLSTLVSINVAPVISGYLISDLGWQWSFRILAIAFAIALVLSFFLMPETLFERIEFSESARPEGPPEQTFLSPDKAGDLDLGSFPTATSKVPSGEPKSDGQAALWRRALGIETVKVQSPGRLFSLMARPLVLLRHPIVLYTCAMWSVTFSWAIIQGAVADQIFGAPPYSLTPASVGLLIGISPLIGSALGTVLGGWLCDFAAQFFSKRNNGVYEPEFRLVAMVPALVTTGVGGFGLGFAVTSGLSIWACAVFLGFLNFGYGMGCTGIVAYSNDACREKAADVFGLAMLVKSAFAFGLTFMLNNYYATHGATVFFSTWTGLTLGVMLTTVPMYIYGKRLRGCLLM